LYEAFVGEKNSEVLKQGLEENLENAITFKKSESGYNQNPIDSDLGLTKSQNDETSFQRTCPRLHCPLSMHSGRTERKPA